MEVLEFGWRVQVRLLESLGGEFTPRRSDGGLFRTDQGNLILNSRFGPITEPAALSAALQARAGIIEHGLFIGIAQDLFVAGTSGVRHVRRGDHDAIAAVFAARLPEPR